MDHTLMVLSVLLWSSGLRAEQNHNHSETVRLVGGSSCCSGTLEVKQGDWRPVFNSDWTLKEADVVCRELDCGSAVSIDWRKESLDRPVWGIRYDCLHSASALRDCVKPDSSFFSLGLTCSDSVRLVNGTSLCSGRLEVKSDQSNQWWSSVCEADFDQQDAEVVCRELGCGAPSVLQGALYGEVEAEGECGGNESALLDCRSSARNTCPSGKSVGLTCSEPVRLVGGSSRCTGTLKVKQGEWRPVNDYQWTLKEAAVVCRKLKCGSNVSIELRKESSDRPVWRIRSDCVHSASAVRDCLKPDSSTYILEITCSGLHAEENHNHSETVRLVGGSSRCTGRLEVKQGDWRPVFNSDWTLKDTDVACRELDCGSAVSIELGEESSDRPVWKIRYDCVHSASALRDCVKPDSSPFSLDLTCSDSVRLVDGTSLCSGRLEVKFNQSNQWWSSVCEADFDQQDAEVVCRELGCGAPSVLQGALYEEVEAPMWTKKFQCGGHESALLDCRSSGSARNTCLHGKAVGLTCSGRRGALISVHSLCSFTDDSLVSEPVRLVGGSRPCTGTLEMKQRTEWRPVKDWNYQWTLNEAAVVCRELDCGSTVSIQWRQESSDRPVWGIRTDCVHSASAVRDCLKPDSSLYILEITCSDLLVRPNITFFADRDSEARQQGFQVRTGSNFTLSCSTEPQHLGGSFQLTFTSSTSAYNYTQPAVNHSAHFLFPAAEPAHQGSYSCVYHVYISSHKFSSESRLLSLTVSDLLLKKAPPGQRAFPPVFLFALVLLLLSLTLYITALYFSCRDTRRRQSERQTDTELSNLMRLKERS
ncbi:scavenger receptor cysteine-rich type 1 protein M130-like isoform X2 [Dicentrarchus labrax]|uniref:scavenger receptor cysteine-rich type 1 protein M130-like isoform X2 n=1 Tax=Dicentrarchus labrax TaxID=13489 RepID=UPI0021F61700|nr:scavenger receptor cysteine-rich type 1 protein M130-like isoform X2 [Dicentrarchus labrax]